VLAGGRRSEQDESILSEWKSDISTSAMPIKKGPRTAHYDKQKGRLSYMKYLHSVSNGVHCLLIFCAVKVLWHEINNDDYVFNHPCEPALSSLLITGATKNCACRKR